MGNLNKHSSLLLVLRVKRDTSQHLKLETQNSCHLSVCLTHTYIYNSQVPLASAIFSWRQKHFYRSDLAFDKSFTIFAQITKLCYFSFHCKAVVMIFSREGNNKVINNNGECDESFYYLLINERRFYLWSVKREQWGSEARHDEWSFMWKLRGKDNRLAGLLIFNGLWSNVDG